MFDVSDTARDNLQKIMAAETAKNKHLIIYFQGFG